MKRIALTVALLLMTFIAQAQAPYRMTYQAIVRTATNTLLTNTQVGMRITILQASAVGTPVYMEVQAPTTNANGLATLQIGGGVTIMGSMAAIDWSQGPYFIKTETDPYGGTNYTVTGTTELLSVPYALYSNTTGNGGAAQAGHYIGQQYGGGVIFHIWTDSIGTQHGLIVSMTDQSTSAAWSNVTGSALGQSAQSLFDGEGNSTAIASQPGHTNSAAKLCLDLVSGGQSDWYLPSLDELALLYRSRFNVNGTLSTIAVADLLPVWADYWCSTEFTPSSVWYFSFYNGSVAFNDKSTQYRVRAVRKF